MKIYNNSNSLLIWKIIYYWHQFLLKRGKVLVYLQPVDQRCDLPETKRFTIKSQYGIVKIAFNVRVDSTQNKWCWTNFYGQLDTTYHRSAQYWKKKIDAYIPGSPYGQTPTPENEILNILEKIYNVIAEWQPIEKQLKYRK